MSVKITYTCDICRTQHDKTNILGVYFEGNIKFSLMDSTSVYFIDHKGVHICKSCLDQLKTSGKEEGDS